MAYKLTCTMINKAKNSHEIVLRSPFINGTTLSVSVFSQLLVAIVIE